MTKVSKHCKQCDSTEIFQQTYWTWDVEAQDWKASDDDVITCSDCGYSGYSYATKEVQDPRTEEQE